MPAADITLESLLGSRSKIAIWRVLLPLRVPLTGREVARRAKVAPDTASRTLNELSELGVVERTPGGRDVLFRVREPPPPAVGSLQRLFAEESASTSGLLDHVRSAARAMRPRPLSVVLYGSAADRTVAAPRDIDLLAVARSPAEARELRERAGEWKDRLQRVSGLPVSLIVRSAGVLRRARGSSLVEQAQRSGILLVGRALHERRR